MNNESEFTQYIRGLCTEGQMAYLKMSQRYFFTMLQEIRAIMGTYFAAMGQITLVDIGPFIPYTVALAHFLSQEFKKDISVHVIDMPSSEKPHPSEGQGVVMPRVGQSIFRNIEADEFQEFYGKYDLVLFTSVLEHLIFHPYKAVCTAYHLLNEGGILFLSVPNALSLSTLVKYFTRTNVYDQYSLEGVYGRHNREYTPKETVDIAKYVGLDVMHSKVVKFPPVQMNSRFRTAAYNILYRLSSWFGTDTFVVARKGKPQPQFPPAEPPSWLYRASPGLKTTFK